MSLADQFFQWFTQALALVACTLLSMHAVTLFSIRTAGDDSVARKLRFLSITAASYAFLTLLAMPPLTQLLPFQSVWLFLGSAGLTALLAYCHFMSERLNVRLPGKTLFHTTIAIALAAMVLMYLDVEFLRWGIFGEKLVPSSQKNIFNLGQPYVVETGILFQLAIGLTVPFNLLYSTLFLRVAWREKNRLLIFGISTNFLIFLNDAAYATLYLEAKYLLPIAFLGYMVEISFFTYAQYREKIQAHAELENELIEAGKDAEIGAMVGQICHDLRTPMATIEGWNRIFLLGSAGSPENPDLKRGAEAIERSLQRMSLTINDYLKLARNDHSSEKENVSVELAVRRVLQLTEHKRIACRVPSIKAEIPTELAAYVRENRLVMGLINLVNNACEAASNLEERWIQIQAFQEPQDSHVTIRVTDSGRGIPEEHRKFLFLKKHTTKSSGTGLGLRFVAKVMQIEGGSIAYDEQAVNTTFVIRLPGAQKALNPEAEQADPEMLRRSA